MWAILEFSMEHISYSMCRYFSKAPGHLCFLSLEEEEMRQRGQIIIILLCLEDTIKGQGWRCPKAQCVQLALANLRSLQLSTNPKWFTEQWVGKTTNKCIFHGIISFPVAVPQAWNTLPWHQAGGLTVSPLLKQLGAACGEYPPREVKLKTSVQNVLRHLTHALTLTAAFWDFDMIFVCSSS